MSRDRTACGSIKPIVSSQFHLPVRLINHNSLTARNLDQLTFSEHIAKTARSCRFALFNIKKIRPFLSEHASQLCVQALVLSRLDYCNALLAGLPASSIKPLQLIQNAAARLIFNELKRTRHTSVHQSALATNSCSHKIQDIEVCLQNQHWLCTPLPKFITSDFCSSRSLCSASERHFIVHPKEAQNHFYINCSLLTNSIPAAESLAILKNRLKTHLFIFI